MISVNSFVLPILLLVDAPFQSLDRPWESRGHLHQLTVMCGDEKGNVVTSGTKAEVSEV